MLGLLLWLGFNRRLGGGRFLFFRCLLLDCLSVNTEHAKNRAHAFIDAFPSHRRSLTRALLNVGAETDRFLFARREVADETVVLLRRLHARVVRRLFEFSRRGYHGCPGFHFLETHGAHQALKTDAHLFERLFLLGDVARVGAVILETLNSGRLLCNVGLLSLDSFLQREHIRQHARSLRHPVIARVVSHLNLELGWIDFEKSVLESLLRAQSLSRIFGILSFVRSRAQQLGSQLPPGAIARVQDGCLRSAELTLVGVSPPVQVVLVLFQASVEALQPAVRTQTRHGELHQHDARAIHIETIWAMRQPRGSTGGEGNRTKHLFQIRGVIRRN